MIGLKIYIHQIGLMKYQEVDKMKEKNVALMILCVVVIIAIVGSWNAYAVI